MTELTDAFGTRDLRHDADRIRALARTIAADAHGADDLAQQLALSELSRPAHTRQPRSLAWVASALRNLARKEHRGERRRRRRELLAATRGHERPADEAVQHAETLQRVVAAALALDEPYRTTILLRFLEDLPVGEVARRMGVPASTVRVRTKRAVDRLREKLQRDLGPQWAACLLAFAGRSPAPAVPSSSEPVTGGMTKMAISMTCAAVLGTALLTVGGLRPSLSSTAPPQRPQQGGAPEVSAPGVAARARRVVSAGEAQDGAAVPAHPPLRGAVVDVRGEPVAGATVRVFEQPFEGAEAVRSGDVIRPPVAVTTGADGTWTIAALHPFSTWGVEVRAPGFAPALHMQRPDAETTVTLHPDASLVGTVRDADSGRPLAGVAVRVRDVRVDGDRIHLSRAVTTDAHGRYALEGVRAGAPLRVEFARPGAASVFAVLSLRPHTENEHDVPLGGAAAVELLVLDAATKQPIPGARVWSAGFGADELGTSGRDGRFRIPVPRVPGVIPARDDFDARAKVLVHAAGYCATAAWLPVPPADGTRALEIRLMRSGRLEGVVRDRTGAPIAGAHVGWRVEPLAWVEPGGSALVGPDSRRAVTDAEGRFAMPHVVPGEEGMEGELRAWAAAGTATVHALPAAAGETHEVEIVLGGGVEVSGRALVNGVGTAAYVYAEQLDGGRNVRTRAVDDGRFAFFDLAPGRYRFELITSEGTATSVERIVDVREAITDLEIDLRAPFAQIRGRVLTEAGAPAVGREVLAFLTHHGEPRDADTEDGESFEIALDGPEGGAGLQTVASVAEVEPDGSFTLNVTPDPTARYRVAVYDGGFGIAATGVWQGCVDVELRVPRLAPVTVELVRKDGSGPVSRAGVRWSHPASGRDVTLAWRRPRETASGVLDLKLPVGDVVLTLRDAARGTERTVEVRVPEEGLRERVRVEL